MNRANTIKRYSDRAAGADDAGFIVSVFDEPHARLHLRPASRDRVIARIQDPDWRHGIILEGTSPVGMFAMVLHDGWLAEFARIATVRMGDGIGTYAVQRMLTIAFSELGAHRAYLDVTADNAIARRLYERSGFRLEALFREGYQDRDGNFRDLCGYGMLRTDWH